MVSKQKVAIVSYWAPPQAAVASHRILRLSRALLAEGHDVHWVTLDRALLGNANATLKLGDRDATLEPHIPPEVVRHGLGGPSLVTKPKADGLVEKLLRTIVFKLPDWFAVPDGHFAWTLRLRRHLSDIVSKQQIDTLFVSCGPHGQLLVLPAVRREHPSLRIIVDYRDLLSGNSWRESKSKRLRDKLLKRERTALAAVDTLFVNSDDAHRRFLDMVQPPARLEVSVMRNAADYRLADDILREQEPKALGEGIHLGYFGTVFERRRLLPVLEAINRLPEEKARRFRFHCFCDDWSMGLLDEDRKAAGGVAADQVVWHAPVPYAEALGAMRAMHALVLVNGPTDEDSIFIPGKVFDYIMARRPVLFVGGMGDAWRIVARVCGEEWCSRHTEPEKLVSALERLGEGDMDLIPVVEAFGSEATFEPLLALLRS